MRNVVLAYDRQEAKEVIVYLKIIGLEARSCQEENNFHKLKKYKNEKDKKMIVK